jgi:uncharacterized protein
MNGMQRWVGTEAVAVAGAAMGAITGLCSPGLAQATATSTAATPSFDCAKADGDVERLICKDPQLAGLDRKLDGVYKAASAKATGDMVALLKSEQRGWVKGRNDCWKANGNETWITATWTVNTVRACVDAQYRLRISELQSTWQLVPPKTISYACNNNPANEVIANHYATDPATIRLERGDRTVTLWQVGAPAAGKYEGQNVGVVKQAHGGLQVSWLDVNTGKTDELACKPR